MIPIYQVIGAVSGAMHDRGARVSAIAKHFGDRPPYGREGAPLVPGRGDCGLDCC